MRPLNQADPAERYEPGTTLIPLFHGKGYRVLPGGAVSNRPTHLDAGASVALVEDPGTGYIRFAFKAGGDVYEGYRSDFCPLPNAQEIAWLLIAHAQTANALEDVKAELVKARTALGEALASLGEVTVERDVALAERSAAVKANHNLRGRIARALDARETD